MDSTTSTFSSVTPRAIFTHTTTCCGLEKCQPVLQDYGMTLRQAAGPLSTYNARLTNDRTDSWQGGWSLCCGDGFGLFVYLQSISERVLSALACLLEERMVCLTAERG